MSMLIERQKLKKEIKALKEERERLVSYNNIMCNNRCSRCGHKVGVKEKLYKINVYPFELRFCKGCRKELLEVLNS